MEGENGGKENGGREWRERRAGKKMAGENGGREWRERRAGRKMAGKKMTRYIVGKWLRESTKFCFPPTARREKEQRGKYKVLLIQPFSAYGKPKRSSVGARPKTSLRSTARRRPTLRPTWRSLRPTGSRKGFFGFSQAEKCLFGLPKTDGVLFLQYTSSQC
jgi:hypothetical protein